MLSPSGTGTMGAADRRAIWAPAIQSLRLFYMAVWRNWLELRAYKMNYVFTLLTSVVWAAGMLLLALVFDAELLERTVGTTNYASFAVLGLSYQAWQSVALWSSANMLRNELTTGQIDYTFTCPFSRYGYIVSNIAAQGVRETVFFLPMFLVGLWFARSTVTVDGLVLGLLATALSVAVLVQFGALFAALALRHRQVEGVFGFFNFAFQFLTGLFIPMQVIPEPFRTIGLAFLPQTHGMDLLRHYVMDTQTILDVGSEWLILLGQLVALGTLSWYAIRRLERSAREEGLHYV